MATDVPRGANGQPTGTMGGDTVQTTINGVTIILRRHSQATNGNEVVGIVAADGTHLGVPKGTTFNSDKHTIDLPGGDHLSFHNGQPIRNTPNPKTNKLAATTYVQNPYTGPDQKIAAGVDLHPAPVHTTPFSDHNYDTAHPQATPAIDPVHDAAPMPTGGGKTSFPGPAPTAPVGGSVQQIAGGGNTHDFAVAVLRGLGLPTTQSNVQAIMAWSQAESLPGRGASFNPLNTTQGAPGATNFNSVGVKNFTSFDQGVQATIQTLRNGHYGPILSAFHQGSDAFAVARAVAASPWGTGQGVLNVLNAGHVQNQPIASSAPDGSYGPPTGNTGSGAGSPAAGGGNSSVPDFDPKKFSAALAAAGFSAHLINSNPELKAAFQNAVSTQQSPEDFKNAIVNTHWYQSRSGSQRAFDLQNQSDHSTLSRQVQAESASIMAQAAQLGVSITPLRAHDLAVTALRNGLNPDEMKKSLASEANYNPQASYGGTYGDSVAKIKQAMAAYNIKLDDATIGQFAQQITAGTSDLTKIGSFLQQQAASKYPWLKPQLDQGFTVSQLQSPYITQMAQSLEVAPDTIDKNDPLLQQAMQMSDGKGGYTTMPLYQFDQKVKSDPRWMKTNNARNSLMDVGVGVLQDLGLQS